VFSTTAREFRGSKKKFIASIDISLLTLLFVALGALAIVMNKAEDAVRRSVSRRFRNRDAPLKIVVPDA
jgi:hypothetical protein